MFSFIETRLFTRLVQDYLDDDEYRELQGVLIGNPETGDIVPGSGGVRKFRWRAPGRGKRGGYRVIYYARITQGVIWMLTMYPKNVAENIPAHVLRPDSKGGRRWLNPNATSVSRSLKDFVKSSAASMVA